MIWNDFIKPIRQAGISYDAAWKILSQLFKLAGCVDDFSEATAKKWLYGTRNCKVNIYFPTGNVDSKMVFRYFRNRNDSKLQQLQRIFQEQLSSNSDSLIDTKTADLDIFCWSLVKQFLDLLNLQLIEIHLGDSSIVAPPLDSQEIGQPNGELVEGLEQPSIRSKLLPHSDKCCFYCIYWNGNKATVSAYRSATYATCLKYNRENQLSSTAVCKSYKSDQSLINQMKLLGYNTEQLI